MIIYSDQKREYKGKSKVIELINQGKSVHDAMVAVYGVEGLKQKLGDALKARR